MNAIERIFLHHPDPTAFARGYCDYVGNLLGRLDHSQIGGFIERLLQAQQRRSRIFFIGNGGSAATASHFANDLSNCSRHHANPLRAISLCDNLPLITAIANDFGYDQIFLHQLETQMGPDDMVVALSASGNSPNILNAVTYANHHGALTVGLTGFDGGQLRQLAQWSIHVPSNPGEYGPVEDIHMILDHVVAAFLMYREK